MTRLSLLRLGAIITAFSTLASGCATSSRTEPTAPTPPATTAPTPGTDAQALAELERLYWARQDSALANYTEADVRFMSGMIAHHAQAIVMASLATEREASSAIRTLAARIISSQQDEIATMQEWLRDRGLPVPELHGSGADLMVHGVDHTHMAGMLSPEQLQELRQASGPEFDRLFLTFMIQHHRGAVEMVEQLFASDGAAQDHVVFRLASDIQVDQRTEIARMERMLAGLTPAGTR